MKLLNKKVNQSHNSRFSLKKLFMFIITIIFIVILIGSGLGLDNKLINHLPSDESVAKIVISHLYFLIR